jgi:hypothetical protein
MNLRFARIQAQSFAEAEPGKTRIVVTFGLVTASEDAQVDGQVEAFIVVNDLNSRTVGELVTLSLEQLRSEISPDINIVK